ncbi:MAG: SDR family NAD(P)-dependent oxidoreductase [Actinomycetes bacterium]
MGQLDGRVAVVTGAGEGIGRGIARRFVDEGARVVVAEINDGLCAALSDELGDNAYFVQTDVSNKTDVQRAVEAADQHFGSIDILVNNAWGGGEIGRLENKSDELIAHGLAVGLYGPLWAMQAAYSHMKANGYGRIINMCSLNGVNAHMGTTEYNVAKEGLRALSRTAAREWAASGVTVNVICPAARSAAFERVIQQHPEIGEMAAGMNPMGRMGDPYDDIAPVAVFLASQSARYLTGNTLFVDGGGHINGVAWQPELPE